VMLMLIVVSLAIKLVQLCFINMALTTREVCNPLFEACDPLFFYYTGSLLRCVRIGDSNSDF
jgi:hypothetical protein